MPDNSAVEKEKHMKQLKRRMECWREIVLHINSILLWEKSWYPGLILSLTTSLCLLVWLLEPAFLTTVACCLLIVALIDYLVPIVASTLISPSAWNGQKEKKLDEICQNLSATILFAKEEWKFLQNFRNNRPHLYHLSLTVCLVLFIWIGSAVNNLLLIYLIATFLLLVPGIFHKCQGDATVKHAFNCMLRRKVS